MEQRMADSFTPLLLYSFTPLLLYSFTPLLLPPCPTLKNLRAALRFGAFLLAT